jgi:2-amino-4-hydroxy-6-hydroxymethyldihydropteridine diphosphokinase
MAKTAYISLGSNIGDRQKYLREAVAHLGVNNRVLRTSSLYETEPVEFTRQAWFLNCAVAIETEKSPTELMASLLSIELELGRRRLQRKGPRTIDMDILLFEDTVVESPNLVVPHPAMQQRRFVLDPMAEIAPDVVHPVLKKTMRELLTELPAGQVVRKLPASKAK